MTSQPRVILFDLWMTLVYSLPVDPILSLQQMLGYKTDGGRAPQLDPLFLRACLTTNIVDEAAFLKHIAGTLAVDVPEGAGERFTALLQSERAGVTRYPETDQVLTALKERGVRLGLVSNLWPFPVHHIFNHLGLGAHFEHLVYSFAVGAPKPEAAIFHDACSRFGVSPQECLMVGDSMGSDIAGAVGVNMPATLINRSGKPVSGLTAGVSQIASLQELLV